jgi:hypothetical protein
LKDYTQILHAVFINNKSSTIIQIITDSAQLKYALLMSTEIFGVSQYSTSPTKVYSITAMIVWKVRNYLLINTCIFRQTFLKIMFHIFVHQVYSHLHETIVPLIKSIIKLHKSNNYSKKHEILTTDSSMMYSTVQTAM